VLGATASRTRARSADAPAIFPLLTRVAAAVRREEQPREQDEVQQAQRRQHATLSARHETFPPPRSYSIGDAGAVRQTIRRPPVGCPCRAILYYGCSISHFP
jgi:hypothetical protein